MLPIPPLLLITDRAQVRGDLVAVVASACAGGCRWVSLREKDLGSEEQIALFRRLREATGPWGVRLTLHGEAALAAAAGADGVHLPGGGDAREARDRLGPEALIGLSIHTLEEARAAEPACLDYVTASPVFATLSKPGYGPALGRAGLEAIANACRVPVIALGGIDAGHVEACLEAGASGIAVMGGVMRAADPASAVVSLVKSLRREPTIGK